MPSPNDQNFWLAPGVIEHEPDNRPYSLLEKLLAVVIALSAIFSGFTFWIMVLDLGGWKAVAGIVAAIGFSAWLEIKFKNKKELN